MLSGVTQSTEYLGENYSPTGIPGNLGIVSILGTRPESTKIEMNLTGSMRS